MSSISILGDTSGSVLLQAPAVAGSPTLTLPTTTGTLAINGPAFSAYATTTYQSLAQNTYTKVTFDAEVYDTNNNYASNRFTPTVAGYYTITSKLLFDAAVSKNYAFSNSIYKNGTEYDFVTNVYFFNNQTNTATILATTTLYMNGTTDYVEIYAYQYDYTSGASINGIRGNATTKYSTFTGYMVRGA